MKAPYRVFAWVCGLALLAAPSLLRAQLVTPPAADADQNRKLRIQLDRGTIRAFEPVYLCLTAEQFAEVTDADVQMSFSNGDWQRIPIPKKDWVKSQTAGTGKIPLQRRGVMLQAIETNGLRTWLFSVPGNYKLRVKIGPDSTTLNLTVTAPEAGEAESWGSLEDRINDILENNFADPPEQRTIDICAKVIRRFPKTLCAAYCQSYISITKFKILFDKNHQAGGKAVYGDIADELQKIAKAFHESFFGEMTGFYAAYAKGLTGEFEGTLSIASDMSTHVTPWSDGVMDMRAEVLAHLAPLVVPLDPKQPIPTTGPSTRPAEGTTTLPAKP